MERGLASSRQRARELIVDGAVTVDGLKALKAAMRVRPSQAIALAKPDFPWVGRGALKLLGVLDPFGIHVEGRACADFGASTGGFTDVLLARGARRVYAIDVGRGQLDWRLRTDARVENLEGVNVRQLAGLPEPIDLVVGDLSFISLRLVLPAIGRVLGPTGEAAVLVKPQFEVGREAVAKGGVVRDAGARLAAIDRVRSEAEAGGFTVLHGADSPLPGAKSGNVEHFLHLARAAPAASEALEESEG